MMNFYFYNGTLISHLTVFNYEPRVDDLIELLNDTNNQLFLMDGTASVDYFRNAIQGSVEADVWRRYFQNDDSRHVFEQF